MSEERRVYLVVADYSRQEPIVISAVIWKETATLFKINRDVSQPNSWVFGRQISKADATLTELDAWLRFEAITRSRLDGLKQKVDIERARLVHTERALARIQRNVQAAV